MQGFEHARKQILLGLLKDPDADWPAHPKNHFHGSAILRVGEILGLKPQLGQQILSNSQKISAAVQAATAKQKRLLL